METMSKHHLLNRNGVWYYRRRVPDQLKKTYGKANIQFSLKTPDLKSACKQRNVHDVKFDAEFQELTFAPDTTSVPAKSAGKDVTTLESAREKVLQYIEGELIAFDRRILASPPSNAEEKRDLIIDLEQTVEALGNPEHPEQHQDIDRVFERLFSGSEFKAVTEVEVAELIRRGLRKLVQDEVALVKDQTISGVRSAQSTPDARMHSLSFADVANEYLADEFQKAAHAKRSNEWTEKLASQVGLFVEMIGKSTAIESVGYEDARKVRDSLASIPAHREKRYPSMSLTDALSRRASDGGATLSVTTQKDYLRTFRGILDLAVAKRLIPNNPAFSMKPLGHDARSPSDRRSPFRNEQISQFFSSDFYKMWNVQSPKKYPKNDRDWRFWLPLLMCFNGMRPSEACQLLVSDITKTQAGIVLASVRPTDEDDGSRIKKRIKTPSSRRNFPIHPSLLAVGFEAFVEERNKDGNDALLFKALTPSKRGYYSDYPTRRFREAFLKEAIEVDDEQTFYSFRHSFRDALRRINAPSDVLLSLGGWSDGGKTSDAYGDPKAPDYLMGFVQKVSYEGVQLDFEYIS